MVDLIDRTRMAAKILRDIGEQSAMVATVDEAADALEAVRMGLRYAVRVWVLSDEIDWSEKKIDETMDRVIGYAKKEARNGSF